MKKLFFLFALLFGVYSAQAQFVKPGLRAGANYSTLTNISDTHEPKTGFYVGGLVHLRFFDRYAVQPEFGYSEQGAEAKVTNAFPIDHKYFTMRFVNKFYLNDGLHLMVGPGLNLEFEETNTDILLVNHTPSAADVVILAGVGYEFAVGLTIEARFQQGVLDSGFFDSPFSGSDDNTFSQVAEVGLSYQFTRNKSKD